MPPNVISITHKPVEMLVLPFCTSYAVANDGGERKVSAGDGTTRTKSFRSDATSPFLKAQEKQKVRTNNRWTAKKRTSETQKAETSGLFFFLALEFFCVAEIAMGRFPNAWNRFFIERNQSKFLI